MHQFTYFQNGSPNFENGFGNKKLSENKSLSNLSNFSFTTLSKEHFNDVHQLTYSQNGNPNFENVIGNKQLSENKSLSKMDVGSRSLLCQRSILRMCTNSHTFKMVTRILKTFLVTKNFPKINHFQTSRTSRSLLCQRSILMMCTN